MLPVRVPPAATSEIIQIGNPSALEDLDYDVEPMMCLMCELARPQKRLFAVLYVGVQCRRVLRGVTGLCPK